MAFFVLYFVPEPFIRIFSTDNELVAMASYAAQRIFMALYLLGVVFVGSLIFQSIGKAVESFITAIARPALFLVPLIFIMSRFMQMEGVWLAFPITDALTMILTIILLIPQIKRFRSGDVPVKMEPFPLRPEQFGGLKTDDIQGRVKAEEQSDTDQY